MAHNDPVPLTILQHNQLFIKCDLIVCDLTRNTSDSAFIKGFRVFERKLSSGKLHRMTTINCYQYNVQSRFFYLNIVRHDLVNLTKAPTFLRL